MSEGQESAAPPPPPEPTLGNEVVARRLEEVARLLEIQNADVHRVRAWRSGASVSELLEVDAEYRRKAAARELKRIAPRRFNPKHEAWLPVLHTRRGGREYTVLFSNTARAHELGRTQDWVVIYHDGPGGEHRETVVTVRGGALAGKRIVRGREAECTRFYTQPRHGAAMPAETVVAGGTDATWWEKAGWQFDAGRRGGPDANQ